MAPFVTISVTPVPEMVISRVRGGFHSKALPAAASLPRWHRSCFTVDVMKQHPPARPTHFLSHLLALSCVSVLAFSLNATLVRAEPGTHATGTQRFDQQMEPILQSYLKIGHALSGDSLEGVPTSAKGIGAQTAVLDSSSVTGEHAAHYKDVPTNLRKAAQTLSQAKTLDEARASFKKLSMPMAMWVTMSKPNNIDVVYCSMAKGSWVQKHGKVRNPYFGADMLDCGEVVGGESHAAQKC